MSNYEYTLDFDIELPSGVKLAEGVRPQLRLTEHRKSFAVVKLTNGVLNARPYYTDGFADCVSLHDTMKLAEARANKENRQNENIDIDFLPVALTIANRGMSYFDNSGQSGSASDADNFVILDTAGWTQRQWQNITFTRKKAELARHYNAAKHEFSNKGTRWDYKDKKWVNVLSCAECFLTKEELGL